MATTENTIGPNVTGTGPHSFTFPYIKADDVKVSKNGTALTKVASSPGATEYTLATTSVTLGAALVNTDRLRIYRVTSDSDLTATFYPGSAIRSADLNDNFTQNLYSTQEVVSRYLDAGGNIVVKGDMDVGGYKLDNAGKITSTELDISGDIDINGVTNLDVTHVSETLSVQGTATIQGAADLNGGLDVYGTTDLDNVNISGAIDVDGTATLDDVVISGTTTSQGHVYMATTLKVSGAVDFDEGIDISGATANLDDVDIDGDLDVDGTTNLDTTNISETLVVQGAVTLHGGVAGNLTATGQITGASLHGDCVVTSGTSTSGEKVYSCSAANAKFFSSDYSTQVNTVYNNIGAVQAVGTDLANSFSNISDYGDVTDAVTSTSGTSDIQTVANSIANVDNVGGSITNVDKVSEDLNLSYTRQLSAQTGTSITATAVSSSSPYSGQSDRDAQIYNYLWDNKVYFDFDGDGIVSPTDGQIFLRLLIGAAYSGDAVKNGLYMSANATRTTGAAIWDWFEDHRDNTTIARGTYNGSDIGTKDVYDIDASSGTPSALGAGLLMVRVFGAYDDTSSDPKDITSTSTFLTPHDNGPAVWNSDTSTWDWPGTSKITIVYNDIKEGGNNYTNTVANSIANVNAVGPSIANVNIIATTTDLITDIATVAGDAADIGVVAGKEAEIGRLGTADAVADMEALNDTDVLADMSSCRTNISSINSASANATTAVNAKNDAVTAKTEAETAETNAETAQAASETARDLAEDYKDLTVSTYSDVKGVYEQQRSIAYNINSASDFGNLASTAGIFASETTDTLLTMSEGSSTYDYAGV